MPTLIKDPAKLIPQEQKISKQILSTGDNEFAVIYTGVLGIVGIAVSGIAAFLRYKEILHSPRRK